MPGDGDRLGNYRVLRELGRGGMGIVYEVEREETGGRFALKTLTLGLGHDPELAARFVREGQLAARLDHPHVVRTHAAAFEGTRPWIVQDLLPGGSLHDRLRASGPLPVEEAVEVARKVALGLAHAHERGVLHRDVKPENVLFDEEGEPRLVDFGVARPTVAGASGRLTATGQVIGSPAFMAPEQALGDPVDARADVHAVGALLHTLLTGAPPFVGASTMEVLEAVISRPPRPLRSLRPEVPEAVERVVLRALAKRPDDRFPSAVAFAAALAACRAPAARPSSRVVPALVAVSVASTLLAALALVLARPEPARTPPGSAPPPPAPPTEQQREPDTPAPVATEWPGWGPTFSAPVTFELSRDARVGETDMFLMTLVAEPAVPSAVTPGRATIAMTISRLAFQLGSDLMRVIYDSADPEQQGLPVDGMAALIERTLASRLSVEVVLRTGEVTAVTGLPNAPDEAVGRLGTALPRVLHDDAVRGLLDNVLHLFPDPTTGKLVTTTWLQRGLGLRGERRVVAGEDGALRHSLALEPTLTKMDGYAFTRGTAAGAPAIEATGRLAAGRVVSSELDARFVDGSRTQQHIRFRFQPLATGR